jgi:hypothetical protein
MANAATIPMMMTTTMSSMSEKPAAPCERSPRDARTRADMETTTWGLRASVVPPP